MVDESEDNFEKRVRAIAEQIERALSDTDIDQVAQRFGIDPERVRGVERWLQESLAEQWPLFGEQTPGDGQNFRAHDADASASTGAPITSGLGPHPLDLPTPSQGLALSALDSGRFTVRPGSGALVAAKPGTEPFTGESVDVVNDLRARDWITADGTVTLVGRQALLRWCRTADGLIPDR